MIITDFGFDFQESKSSKIMESFKVRSFFLAAEFVHIGSKQTNHFEKNDSPGKDLNKMYATFKILKLIKSTLN